MADVDEFLASVLPVTTVSRREAGEWNVVHRHIDPLPGSASARAQLDRMIDERT